MCRITFDSTTVPTDEFCETMSRDTIHVEAEKKALHKASRAWGRSEPSEPLRPYKSESHFLSVGVEIEAEVAAELEKEITVLADKTREALAKSYAEVDRQRQERDESAIRLESLEEELARLTREVVRERPPSSNKAKDLKIKLTALPFIRRLSEESQKSLECDDDSSLHSQHFFPGIRWSCSVITSCLTSEESFPVGASENANGAENAMLKRRIAALKDKGKTSIEELGRKLQERAAAEDDFAETFEQNDRTLASLHNGLIELQLHRKEAKSKAMAEIRKLQDECIGLKCNARANTCNNIENAGDPLSHYLCASGRNMWQSPTRQTRSVRAA